MRKIIAALAFVALTATAGAVEFVTLFTGEEKVVSASSVIEVSARRGGSNADGYVKLFRGTKQDGINVQGNAPPHTFPVTGVTKISAGSNCIATLKIYSAAELQETTSGVVALPTITGQGYAVTLEHSTDLANWQPVAPGEFTGSATPQFFRVRLKNAPETPE